MMMNDPILEIDVHGMGTMDAIVAIQKKVDFAGPSVYKIRVIHGCNNGTRIRNAIRDTYRTGRISKVKRVAEGANAGITELILKELF